MKTLFPVLLLFVTTLFGALNVPLTVKEGAGAGNVSGYPVKVGVPLPLGAYENTNSFRVTDAAGNTVPAQFEILARYWPKSRSLRGVLVHFTADVASSGKSRYYLKDDGTGSTQSGIVITQNADRYFVNAGNLKLQIRKSRFNIIDSLWFDANNNGTFEATEAMIESGSENGAVLVDTNGAISRDTTKTQLKFDLEEAGPLRMVLKVESATDAAPNGWGFMVRIIAYYNQPFVVLDYYVKNSVFGHTGHFVDFSKFSLVAGIKNLGAATARAGGSLVDNAGSFEGALEASSITTQSTVWQGYNVNGAAKTGLGVGYVDISDNTKGVMAVTKKFSQMWPSGLEVTAGKQLSINLWPQGKYRLVDGVRRSHQVMLYFHPGNATQADLFKQAKLFQQSPVPVLQPAWYSQTCAIGNWGGIGYPTDTTWNEALWTPALYYPATDSRHVTGWSNWGGAFVNGTDVRRVSNLTGNWPPDLQTFIACGTAEYFYHMDDLSRHSAEMRPMWMDDYSYPNCNGMLNLVHEYTPGSAQWGYRQPLYGNDTLNWGSWDLEHTWVYEMGEYYFFSGERFCVDDLKMHADLLLAEWGWEESLLKNNNAPPLRPFIGFSREDAEPLDVIVDAYKATGEKRYWDFLHYWATFLVDQMKYSDFGLYCTSGFMGSFVNNTATQIYFLLSENTPEDRVLKEKLLLTIQGNTQATFYYMSNSFTTAPTAWGVDYSWHGGESLGVYTFPTTDRIDGTGLPYNTYHFNELGLMYFLMGDSCYRQLIGRMNMEGSSIILPQHFLQAKDDVTPCSYFRISTAAWYYPEMKKAVKPSPITTLRAAQSYSKKVLLTWTSAGGKAYRIHWSDKPIVERSAPIAPRGTGSILWSYPDTNKSVVTNIYRAIPLDVQLIPKAAGQIDTFETPVLPDSLIGRKVYFNIQAVNIVSDVDQSRGSPSNLDSIVLSGASGTGYPGAAPLQSLLIQDVYSSGHGDTLFVVLNLPIKVPAAIQLAITNTIARTKCPITSVEIDTGCKSLLRIATGPLTEGQEYSIVLDSLFLNSGGVTPLRINADFLATFAPNIFSTWKVNFGSTYHRNGYIPAHSFDGRMGYPQLWWDAISPSDGSVLNDPDSAKHSMAGVNLNSSAWNSKPYSFGDVWFKIKVSPLIKDYLFSAFTNHDARLDLKVEDTLVWNQDIAVNSVHSLDTLPIKINDGMLDVAWRLLSYIHLKPVFENFQSVLFGDVKIETSKEVAFQSAYLTNYPNPSNPSTRLEFSPGRLATGTRVKLTICNISGQIVRDFNLAQIQSGSVYKVEWNGKDLNGRNTGTGLYIARLSCGNKVLCRKLMLLK